MSAKTGDSPGIAAAASVGAAHRVIPIASVRTANVSPGVGPAGPIAAAGSACGRWFSSQPRMPAASTTSGKGAAKKKRAMNAAAATSRAALVFNALRPIRAMASTTIASTAAWMPNRIPRTSATCPRLT